MAADISKRFVFDELPNQATVDELELGTSVETAQFILALASRILVDSIANDRNTLYRATRVLGVAMSVELIDEDGDHAPGLLESPMGPLTTAGETAAKRLGIDPMEMNAAWATGGDHVTSCLPLECVCGYLRPAAWSYLGALIAVGPDEARLRVLAAADVLGKTTGAKSLSSCLDEMWRVMRHLVELRAEMVGNNHLRAKKGKEPLPVPAGLEQWTAVPPKLSAKVIKQKAKSGVKLDTTAVPPHLIREWLHYYAREAEWGRWKPEEWPVNRNWMKLKRLAVLAVLGVLGPREAHLSRIEAADFCPAYRFRDGSIAPALVFHGERKMKNREPGYELSVRLPDTFAEILVAWLACNGRKPGEGAGEPLFSPSKRRTPDSGQVFYHRIRSFVAGKNRDGVRIRPLVPLPGETYKGYKPHQFRSTMKQEVQRLVTHWRRENPDHPLSGYDERIFPECALDHLYQDLGYLDLRDNQGDPTYRYEQIVALTVELWWQELWQSGPFVRRGLDADAIEDALKRMRVLEAELEMLTARSADLERQSRSLRRRAEAEQGNARASLLEAAFDASDEFEAAARHVHEVSAALADARARLARACEEDVELPITDDDEVYAARLKRLMAAAVAAEPGADPQPREAPLADELTPADIARLYGVTATHVGRWRRGASPSPFGLDHWREESPRDFRYPVASLLQDESAMRAIPSSDPISTLNRIRRQRAEAGFRRSPRVRDVDGSVSEAATDPTAPAEFMDQAA